MCASQKSFFQPQAFENQDVSHGDNYSSPEPCLFRSEPCVLINKSSLKCLSCFWQGYNNLDACFVTPTGKRTIPHLGMRKGKAR